ncbi:MAG: methionine synthase [Chloroflexi bacterium 44-23]|nr:MAG: methionine synthase [Chloroflexi bacterium 44-23]
MNKTVVAAALGECVHVAGISNFLRLAETAGWETIFLGPAVPIESVLQAAREHHAGLVGISYRLTPETAQRLLGDFAEAADELRSQGVHFAFGGTPPVAEKARALSFFEQVFDGSEHTEEILAYLKGQPLHAKTSQKDFPQTMLERLRWKAPLPLLRHHFGLPTMQATMNGIAEIARARALDVISLGIDQDAQANFFHPDRQDPQRKGAGGVPVRTPEDYKSLYAASRQGNYPLMRTYSGTDDFIELAQMYVETINNAWCAIPLFWFNQMDGRGPWDLEGSIREHQRVMAWYGHHNIPVELNEPHHWGMRDSSDVIFIVAAYLAAYNAHAFGVNDYIAQLMFNSPAGLSGRMDLAKMLAVLRMIEPLRSDDFRIYRQTRTGLLSYPLADGAARAHLATSIYMQMALKPDIVHIVGHTEAHHAATANDVIQAAEMARRSIEIALNDMADMTADPLVQAQVDFLVNEALLTLDAIRALAPVSHPDPLTDPTILARAVTSGILDAPQLKNNRFARGEIRTRIISGASQACDIHGNPIGEAERLRSLIIKGASE